MGQVVEVVEVVTITVVTIVFVDVIVVVGTITAMVAVTATVYLAANKNIRGITTKMVKPCSSSRAMYTEISSTRVAWRARQNVHMRIAFDNLTGSLILEPGSGFYRPGINADAS